MEIFEAFVDGIVDMITGLIEAIVNIF